MKKRTFKRIRALLILCLAFVVSYNVVFAMGGSKYEVESEIYVECGDTLWTIAKDYYGDEVDTRKAIEAIKKCSGLKNSNIYSGQIIQLPKL